jgi:hypothetical protein
MLVWCSGFCRTVSLFLVGYVSAHPSIQYKQRDPKLLSGFRVL